MANVKAQRVALLKLKRVPIGRLRCCGMRDYDALGAMSDNREKRGAQVFGRFLYIESDVIVVRGREGGGGGGGLSDLGMCPLTIGWI